MNWVTQAEGGRVTARKDPAAALAVLATVARAGQAAMGDMRAPQQALDDREPAEVAPQPGLDDLPDLIGRVRQSGPGLRDRVQVVVLAYEPGLVQPRSS